MSERITEAGLREHEARSVDCVMDSHCRACDDIDSLVAEVRRLRALIVAFDAALDTLYWDDLFEHPVTDALTAEAEAIRAEEGK